MRYRPEYQLDRLRTMRAANVELMHFQWLRTFVVELPCLSNPSQQADERVSLQQRSSNGGAVEQVVLANLTDDQLSRLMLSFLTQSVSVLTSLDVRGCDWSIITDDFLMAVANAHGATLLRLCLPDYAEVAQSTLDNFPRLIELDASRCENLNNVDFCAATLRVLYADECPMLNDLGLRNATKLEVLHVSGTPNVTNVTPFEHCLLELVSHDSFHSSSGIRGEALSRCRRLQVLSVHNKKTITTLQPFAKQLRELDAGGFDCWLTDLALRDAKGLVKLVADGNQFLTTVEPFAPSLRELHNMYGFIGDPGLAEATQLVVLVSNCHIRSLAPFSSSLLELHAKETNGVGDDALAAAAPSLIWLDVSRNMEITTIAPMGRSLRHLVASCAHSLTNEGVSTATDLVSLSCVNALSLSTTEPFQHSLQVLDLSSPRDFQVNLAKSTQLVALHMENEGDDEQHEEQEGKRGVDGDDVPRRWWDVACLRSHGFVPLEGNSWYRETTYQPALV